MNKKQRQHEDRAKLANGDEADDDGLSQPAQEALTQVANVDTMIDDILSSATTGNYLESIRQKGGQ